MGKELGYIMGCKSVEDGDRLAKGDQEPWVPWLVGPAQLVILRGTGMKGLSSSLCGLPGAGRKVFWAFQKGQCLPPAHSDLAVLGFS